MALVMAKVAAALGAQALSQRPDLDPVVLSIEAKLRRAGKGKRLVIENGAEAELNAGLIAMIAEALAIRNQLLSGPDDSIEAMIERLGIARGRLTSLVRLSYLAPDIMRAILEGRQPIELTPTRLLRLTAQSIANQSRGEFPANREINREFQENWRVLAKTT